MHRFIRILTAPLMAVVLAITVPIGNSIRENTAPITWRQAISEWING